MDNLFKSKILKTLDKPYFKLLNELELKYDDLLDVLTSVFKQKVGVRSPMDLGYTEVTDSNGNTIYHENSDGGWFNYRYDSNNKQIFYENYLGYWEKKGFDNNGKQIYYEDISGTMIDNRPNLINESDDKEEVFINKVIQLIDKPYFKSLDMMGIDNVDLQRKIFIKLFGETLTMDYDRYGYTIHGSTDKVLYYEDFDGNWIVTKYDYSNNSEYREFSDGFWTKREYDENNYLIYYEDSLGNIKDNRNNTINESYDSNFIDKILDIIEKPYFKNLDSMGIDDKGLLEDIIKKIYGDDVYVSFGREWYEIYDYNHRILYHESDTGYWIKWINDENGNTIYYEDSGGYWVKREFDHNGNMLYFEDSDGEIVDNRPESINESYDSNFINRIIDVLDKPYFKTLDSIGIDNNELIKNIFGILYNDKVEVVFYEDYVVLYNSNGRMIYYEESDGFWVKREFDENNNEIYYEDSRGYWIKSEYDSNNNQIYYENSRGKIRDNRPGTINESIIDEFIDFAKNELSLSDDFKVNLTSNNDEIETLANYDVENNVISVKTKNRAIPDIIRSIAHEMTHHKQKVNGDLRGRSIEGEDGSPWEDQANAKSGELVRKFGRVKPEIYDL